VADIIQLLPDSLANQIAAGEVVQRPASVVKELLENAIDAQATNIKLFVKEAGKTLIQVIDNGKGMTQNDARMCFERHATSKISKTDDLFCIRTMGFRGEAMASIAAVAQVEMKSKTADAEVGTLLKIEGSEVILQEPIATQNGTSVAVKNLFFNVPARRNFLKSNAIELSHIIEEFTRVALAFPEIAFSMVHNDHEVYNLNGGKLSQRIVALFGNSYKEQLVTIEETTPYVKVYGYVGKPDNAKKRRGEQYFYANDRFIKHNYLHHAVMESYKSLLPEAYYPFYILKMEINPASIDINVHPTKTEIKFEDERTIYGILKTAVKKGLGLYNIAPSINFDVDMNFGNAQSRINYNEVYAENDEKQAPTNYSSYSTKSPQEKSNLKNWEKLFAIKGNDAIDIFNNNNNELETITLESAINQSIDVEEMAEKPVLGSPILQLHKQYLLAQVPAGMLVINQNTAHEKILFEKYMRKNQNVLAASQQSLFPQTITLHPSDYALVQEIQHEINLLGFSFSILSNNTVMISGKPTDLTHADEKEAFIGLVEQYKQYKNELKLDTKETLARALATKSAIKIGTYLNQEEMQAIVNQLFSCNNPAFGLHQNLTFTILTLDKMSQLFHK